MSQYEAQYWTPAHVVDRMLSLRRNHGTVLEPCCGTGAISDRIRDGCLALEVDVTLSLPPYAFVDEFLDWPIAPGGQGDMLFDTIICNPPYVRKGGRRTELLTPAANLFLVFIEQGVRHLAPGGEAIFIVPRGWLHLTSAKRLIAWLRTLGCVTDWIEVTNAEAGWIGADVDTVIFRYELGARGRWPFDVEDGHPLGDLFQVVVGAATGKPRAVVGIPLLCSDRAVHRFEPGDWIRPLPVAARSPADRIYLNARTRSTTPFFRHPHVGHDAGLLALIPRSTDVDLDVWTDRLNAVDWKRQGFAAPDGRLIFGPAALAAARV